MLWLFWRVSVSNFVKPVRNYVLSKWFRCFISRNSFVVIKIRNWVFVRILSILLVFRNWSAITPIWWSRMCWYRVRNRCFFLWKYSTKEILNLFSRGLDILHFGLGLLLPSKTVSGWVLQIVKSVHAICITYLSTLWMVHFVEFTGVDISPLVLMFLSNHVFGHIWTCKVLEV